MSDFIPGAAWRALIEQRWRELSDGERLRLMALCCRECGAIVLLDKGEEETAPVLRNMLAEADR